MDNSTTLPFKISTLKFFLKKHFHPDEINRKARITKLVQRSTSKIKGFELLIALLESALDPHSYPLECIADGMLKNNTNAIMTRQGLSQRINSPECVSFFESIYTTCLSIMAREIRDEINLISVLKGSSIIDRFNKVIVIDSTEFPLDPSLKDDYKGSGGLANHEAAMKICTAFDVKTNCFLDTKIIDRTRPDQILGNITFPFLKKNDLNIFDLGFFSGQYLKGIEERNAFYLCPFFGALNVYQNEETKTALDIGNFLENCMKKESVIDVEIYVGAERKKIRLVAKKLNKGSIKKRREAYLKNCKKHKRQPLEKNLKRMEFLIFLTNLPTSLISSEEIIILYKIRWQIELIFKNWKSQLNLDYLPGTNVYRIQSLVISRLITISIIWILSGYIQKYLETYDDEEISLHKVINWIKHEQRLLKILTGKVEEILKSLLEAAKKWLHKENTCNKQTTRQRLDCFQMFEIESFALF